ncbi:MAG: dethiobiotin synthase [bacterium]|nr:dethiobiotin synthase [bacterium]
MSKGIFITATGTDIGKTYVTALIVKKLHDAGINAGYYKAALSGAEYIDGRLVPGDADYVKRVSGINQSLESMVSYVYENAVSPHLAARIEGNPVEEYKVLEDFKAVCGKHDFVTAEGSGGIVCPIRFDGTKKIFLEDIIKLLGLDTLVVADGGLGTINSAVTTCGYIRSRGIAVRGIILNNYDPESEMHRDNKAMIEQITKIPVIAEVKAGDRELDIDAEVLKAYFSVPKCHW